MATVVRPALFYRSVLVRFSPYPPFRMFGPVSISYRFAFRRFDPLSVFLEEPLAIFMFMFAGEFHFVWIIVVNDVLCAFTVVFQVEHIGTAQEELFGAACWCERR